MDSRAFYRLTGPATWANLPKHWSFSSLQSFEHCPRRWQLANSGYGEDLPRFPQRPNQHTAAGSITHEMLDRLFRALALRALPPVGSATFRSVLASVDLMGSIKHALAEYESDLARHPRGAGMRLRVSERDIYNQVCRLFQAEYARAREARTLEDLATVVEPVAEPGETKARWLSLLEERKVLTEVPLEHPTLALRGVIDLVARQDGHTRLVDFKTGTAKPEHRDQLEMYALLWFRQTGDLPNALEVHYPGNKAIHDVDLAAIEGVEAQATARIREAAEAIRARPARAVVEAQCRVCDVRQFCDEYWRSLAPLVVERSGGVRLQSDWLDVELTVAGDVSAHGFTGTTREGVAVSVVFDDGVLHGPFELETKLRVLSASVAEAGEVRLVRNTEVFHCGEASCALLRAGGGGDPVILGSKR